MTFSERNCWSTKNIQYLLDERSYQREKLTFFIPYPSQPCNFFFSNKFNSLLTVTSIFNYNNTTLTRKVQGLCIPIKVM